MGKKYKSTIMKSSFANNSKVGIVKKQDEGNQEINRDNLLDCHDNKLVLEESKGIQHTRHRKRKLYNEVRRQMEFYFSDANLSKDRFLMQKLRENHNIPLELFLSFNKIKQYVKSTTELVKALSSSTVLELSNDQSQITRIIPITDIKLNDEETEARTIYVESLPANADHEWVEKVFRYASNGANVSYVSIPRYKNSRKLKEFGFVEFEKIDGAQKCIKTFQEFDGILHYENVDPINLCSIQAFLKENYQESENKNKTKREFLSNTGDLNNTEIEDSSTSNFINLTEISETISRNETELSEKFESDLESAEQKISNKKIRKKKKKEKNKKKNIEKPISSTSRPFNVEVDLKELKILPKREWKQLRNKYLNLQREKIKTLKRKSWANKNESDNSKNKQYPLAKFLEHKAAHLNLQKATLVFSPKYQSTQLTKSSEDTVPHSTLAIANVKNFDLKKSPHMNFYRVNKEIDGGLYEEDENDSQSNDTSPLDSSGINSPYSMLEKRRKLLSPITNSTKTEIKKNFTIEKKPLFQFEPGLIIKIEFREPCVDIKSFKEEIKEFKSIKYIDVKEGSMQAYLRCDLPENALVFCQKMDSKTKYKVRILSGTEESKYWDKIMEDRENKLFKRVKIKSKRGREKIPKLISNHIRFVDNED